MSVVLSLIAAIAYGASDFVAGLMSRRSSAYLVAAVAQLAAACAGVVLALVFPWSHVTLVSLGWGLLAGVGSGIGTGFLYRGFAVAKMNVVAPLSAVVAAVLPLAFGLAIGERPSVLSLAGVAVAIPAVWLVARAGGEPAGGGRADTGRRSGTVEGLGAGFGFALLFIGFGQLPEAAGLWPFALAQAFSVPVVVVLAAMSGVALRAGLRDSLAGGRSTVAGMAVAGLLGTAATLLYTLATRIGLLSITAVLTSLYPALTVLLARLVLDERMGRGQLVGLGCAAVAVVLIGVG